MVSRHCRKAAALRAQGPGEIRSRLPPGWRKRRVEPSHRGRISSPTRLPYSLMGPVPSACKVEEACASDLAAAAGERGVHSGVTGEPLPLSGTYAATAAHCLSPSTRGKQEARRLAERRTGVLANEHCQRRAWWRMRVEKRGGTSGRAVTLFPPFGLEAPPFVFPAQSIKIGKKNPRTAPAVSAAASRILSRRRRLRSSPCVRRRGAPPEVP